MSIINSFLHQFIHYSNDYKLLLEYYKEEFPKTKERGEDMFHNLEDSFTPEMVQTFNIDTSIILAAPNKYNYVKRNTFGGIDLLADKKLDVSNCPIVNNDHAILTFIPKIKLLYPKGVKLDFEFPVDDSYSARMYHSHSIYHKYTTDENIPDYHIYNKLYFTVHVDLKRIKKVKNVLTLGLGTPIVSMYFSPKYFIGEPQFASIENVYFIKNDEFVKTFDQIF